MLELLRRDSWWRRLIGGALIVVTAAFPFSAAMADAMQNQAAQGQSFGQDLINIFQQPTWDPNKWEITLTPGNTQNPNTMKAGQLRPYSVNIDCALNHNINTYQKETFTTTDCTYTHDIQTSQVMSHETHTYTWNHAGSYYNDQLTASATLQFDSAFYSQANSLYLTPSWMEWTINYATGAVSTADGYADAGDVTRWRYYVENDHRTSSWGDEVVSVGDTRWNWHGLRDGLIPTNVGGVNTMPVPSNMSASVTPVDINLVCGGNPPFSITHTPPSTITHNGTVYTLTILQAPTCGNGLVAKYRYDWDATGLTSVYSPVRKTAVASTNFSRTALTDAWTPTPASIQYGSNTFTATEAAANISNGTCTGTVTCTNQDPNGCLAFAGSTICPSDPLYAMVSDPPPELAAHGITKACQQVDVTATCEAGLVQGVASDTWTPSPGCQVEANNVTMGVCGGSITCADPANGSCVTVNGLQICPGDENYAKLGLLPPELGNSVLKTCLQANVHSVCHAGWVTAVDPNNPDSWAYSTPECPVEAQRIADGICDGQYTCTNPANPGDCLVVNGLTICPGDANHALLTNPPSPITGIDKLCKTVQITGVCKGNVDTINNFTSAYGSDAAVTNAALNALAEFNTRTDSTGKAYRAIKDAKNRSHPDMTNDPIWGTTDQTLLNMDTIAQTFADCSNQVQFSQTTMQAHSPDIRYCERVPGTAGHTCRADHSITTNTQLITSTATMYLNDWDQRADGFCGGWTATVDFKTGAVSGYLPAGGVSVSGTLDYAATCGAGHTVNAGLTNLGGGGSTYITTVQPPSCANNLIGKYKFVWNCGADAPGQHRYQAGVSSYATYVTGSTWSYVGQNCKALVDNINNGTCTGNITCTAGATTPTDCINVNGVQICPGSGLALAVGTPPPELATAGILPLCQSVDIQGNCSPLKDTQQCVTSANGTVAGTCFNWSDVAGTNGCAQYEADPTCAFVSSQCKPGATDPVDGSCLVYKDTYDCGYTVDIPNVTAQTVMNCPGAVRCMGNDCVTRTPTTSQDFARAVAALQAAQYMTMDADCANLATCTAFTGKYYTCKSALAGIVNCCDSPSGVSLADYITLLTAIGKVDNAITSAAPNGMLGGVRGAWETLRQPFTSAWSEITQPFTTAMENVTSFVTPQATDAAAQLSMEAIEQQMLQGVAQWVGQTFGGAAGNALFQVVDPVTGVVSNAFDVSGNLLAGNLQLGGVIGTALSWIMTAYMIYSVAVLLIQLIWQCEQSEFELGAKRQLRTCHYLGNFCDTSFLGFCVEEKDAYCCYNSPLSRIIQEQVRPQLGLSFGDAEHPNCQGIPVMDLANVNWDTVDLSEWLAILKLTGNLPTVNTVDLNRLTGLQSRLNTNGSRADAATRSNQRIQGLDANNVNQQGAQELWNQTPP